MKILKNIAFGFLVSFLGSIPLGYLNVVGYDVYSRSGFDAMIQFLLGVICIEAVVIYITLIFTDKLMKNKKLIRIIEGFSVIFMFVVAYVFYSGASSEVASGSTIRHYDSPFVLGIVLSCFNFISIPFWTGWNLYLLNAKYIDISKRLRFLYLLGTMLGTFAGMLLIILSLDYITAQAGFFSKYLMGAIIPIGFVGMGIYQGVKFYNKYFRKRVR